MGQSRPLLVTGSVAIDTVTTPHGRAEGVLGGSAVYFAIAASYYVPVRLVAAIGGDFPENFRRFLASREIDLGGLEVRCTSKTFRWTGRFQGDMNAAETVDVRLNVLSEPAPKVPESFTDSDVVFLANTHPTGQRDVLSQLAAPRIAVCDTMNLWIANERESLLRTLASVTGVIINDGEARQLTGENNLVCAAEWILKLGPRFVVVKKGEHGSLLLTQEGVVALPAYPCRNVVDPTGAGDSFAGGFLGWLCTAGEVNARTLRRAIVRGTIAASFTIEDFSVRRLVSLTRQEIEDRVKAFGEMLKLET